MCQFAKKPFSPIFSLFSHFWLSRANHKAVEAHFWDSGPSRWYRSMVWRTTFSFKKNIMILLRGCSQGPWLSWKYLSEKFWFFSIFFIVYNELTYILVDLGVAIFVLPLWQKTWKMPFFRFCHFDQKNWK